MNRQYNMRSSTSSYLGAPVSNVNILKCGGQVLGLSGGEVSVENLQILSTCVSNQPQLLLHPSG